LYRIARSLQSINHYESRNIQFLKQQNNNRKVRGMSGMAAVILLVIALIIVAIKFFGASPTPNRADSSMAPEVLQGIPREGKGGDPLLNAQKNRNTAPTTVKQMTVQEIIGLPHDVLDAEGRRNRDKWSGSATSYAEKVESQGVILDGFLVRAKESGLESANGYVDSLRDFHIWISDAAGDEKASSVIVEMTPRWKAIHPEWRLRYLTALSRTHARVRVTGWLLWDEEHASEVEKSRGTQWEIHPITKFEVFSSGQWRSLSEEGGIPG
jgi:hypothetical protein